MITPSSMSPVPIIYGEDKHWRKLLVFRNNVTVRLQPTDLKYQVLTAQPLHLDKERSWQKKTEDSADF